MAKKNKKKVQQFGFKYNAVIRRIDRATGDILDEERIHNIVVNDGLERVAKRLFANTEDFFDYVAIGEDNTSAQATDTSLGTEVAREQATVSYEASYKAKFEKIFTFGSGESYTITEAGIFDDATASGSTMFNRLVFTGKSVDADTSLSVTITITVGRV